MRRFLYGLTCGLVLGALSAAALVGAGRALAAEPGPGAPAAPERAPASAGPERPPAVRVTPEMTRYSQIRYGLFFAAALVNTLALLFLLERGRSARMRDIAEQRSRHPLGRAYLYWLLFSAAYGLLTLPLTFTASFLLPHRYGLSTQSLAGWIGDSLKAFALSALLAPPVVALLFWTIRRSPRRWWIGFWLASIPLLTLTILLAPILIDPLFNRFRPLQDAALRARILALARQAGIEEGRVFEVDASRRTEAVNAYVTGLGGSARIVLWDTLLRKLDEEEVLFVMAHEMGHYVERHVPILLGASIAGSFFLLWATDRGARRLLRLHGARWKLRGLDDPAALPALLLVLGLLNFFGSPVECALSRTFERRADDFALRLTGNGRAAASAFVKLSEKNLAHPNPPEWIEWWMFTHPPLQERIDRALALSAPPRPGSERGEPAASVDTGERIR